MLKKMSIKKIMVSSLAALMLLVIYLIPDNRREIELSNNSIEYVYDNIKSTIYLVDSDDYVARTSISTCKCDGIDKAKDLLDGLIIEGAKSSIIPNGFRSIIPPGTTIKNIELKDNVITIDFSKELLEVNEKEESRMIEAIIYTLTSIDGIDKVIIKVEGEVINKLPSGTNIPTILDRSYGINKSYDLVNTSNIESYTIYYVNEYNDNKYYVPVTKYINGKNEDRVKVIIKELSSSPIYETNLMSYLNANTNLNNYELVGNDLKLDFNKLLLNDIDENNILEEVIYTISLSMNNIYENIETVSFYIDNNEIHSVNINELK